MIIAAIAAGGSGTRMGGELPKQYMELLGEPILIRTARQLITHPRVDAVVSGVRHDFVSYTRELVEKYLPGENIRITPGGSNRNETLVSIINYSLSELSCADSDIMLTHDAVRPFVPHQVISGTIDALEGCDISTAAIAETDTIAMSRDGTCAEAFPDRSLFFRIQTPQTFRIGAFLTVYAGLSDAEKAAATDVCSLFKKKGRTVHLVEGHRNNIKLTYPEDMILAESILK